MTIYAQLTPDRKAVTGVMKDLDSAFFSELSPEKQAGYRIWIVDPMPTPGKNQIVVEGPIKVGEETARQTWKLQDKKPVRDAVPIEEFDRGVATPAEVQRAIAWLIRKVGAK